MMSYNLIISGGGTGGHIYPAISIADRLTKKINNCNILFVGAKNKMEMKKVPENGYKIIGLYISGLQRNFNLHLNILLPFKIVFSLIHSLIILVRNKPKIIIVTHPLDEKIILKNIKNINKINYKQISFNYSKKNKINLVKI